VLLKGISRNRRRASRYSNILNKSEREREREREREEYLIEAFRRYGKRER
jgi:hypothetical protein